MGLNFNGTEIGSDIKINGNTVQNLKMGTSDVWQSDFIIPEISISQNGRPNYFKILNDELFFCLGDTGKLYTYNNALNQWDIHNNSNFITSYTGSGHYGNFSNSVKYWSGLCYLDGYYYIFRRHAFGDDNISKDAVEIRRITRENLDDASKVDEFKLYTDENSRYFSNLKLGSGLGYYGTSSSNSVTLSGLTTTVDYTHKHIYILVGHSTEKPESDGYNYTDDRSIGGYIYRYDTINQTIELLGWVPRFAYYSGDQVNRISTFFEYDNYRNALLFSTNGGYVYLNGKRTDNYYLIFKFNQSDNNNWTVNSNNVLVDGSSNSVKPAFLYRSSDTRAGFNYSYFENNYIYKLDSDGIITVFNINNVTESTLINLKEHRTATGLTSYCTSMIIYKNKLIVSGMRKGNNDYNYNGVFQYNLKNGNYNFSWE